MRLPAWRCWEEGTLLGGGEQQEWVGAVFPLLWQGFSSAVLPGPNSISSSFSFLNYLLHLFTVCSWCARRCLKSGGWRRLIPVCVPVSMVTAHCPGRGRGVCAVASVMGDPAIVQSLRSELIIRGGQVIREG